MTTIAWDGEYMAADSMATVGGRINALDDVVAEVPGVMRQLIVAERLQNMESKK